MTAEKVAAPVDAAELRKLRRSFNLLWGTLLLTFVITPGLLALAQLVMPHPASCYRYASDGSGACEELAASFDPTIAIIVVVACTVTTLVLLARWSRGPGRAR